MLKARIKTEIKDRGADAILRQVESIGRGSHVTVGYHMQEAKRLPMYRGKVAGSVPVGNYAAFNEYGTNEVPARPTLGPTVTKRQEQFAKQTATLMRKLYTSRGTGPTVRQILDIEGKRIKAWVQTEIRQFQTPANSPITLRLKRFLGLGSKPLQATQSMLKSVTYKVRMSTFPTRRLSRMMGKIERELRRARP